MTDDSSNYFQPFKGYSIGKSVCVEPVTTCFVAVSAQWAKGERTITSYS